MTARPVRPLLQRHLHPRRCCASSISTAASSPPLCGRWCGSSSLPRASATCSACRVIEPYDTYVLYEVYITPGLIGMIQLFNGMQSSLSMVYDREMGSMRTLMVSPLPRWYLLTSKLLASVLVSILQVYAYLAIASLVFNAEDPGVGYLTIIPVLILTGMMLGSIGLLALLADPSAREFRRRDEFRDLPDVLRVHRAESRCGASGNRACRCSTSAPGIPSPMRSS